MCNADRCSDSDTYTTRDLCGIYVNSITYDHPCPDSASAAALCKKDDSVFRPSLESYSGVEAVVLAEEETRAT